MSVEIAKVFETILAAPGMSDAVKVDLRITRRDILLLNRVIERGLSFKEAEKSPNPLEFLSAEQKEELLNLAVDLLSKAGLIELNQKLKEFKA